MVLSKESIEWAIVHLIKENDTDIFPKPIEIELISNQKNYCVDELFKIEIGSYKWHLPRRLVIPKDDLSYRVITQLNPIDSVYLAAIIKEYGAKIESKRSPESDQIVFGNRFSPSTDGFLYKDDGQWRLFWEAAKLESYGYNYVVKFDIADFYNQISHHSLVLQLEEFGFPNQVVKSIKKLIGASTIKMSRGIPVGPHSTHLLAEAVLVPIDNSLRLHGITYCRYMDDFVAFCDSEVECRIVLNIVAEILDKQGRLILQRHKTKIFTSEEFLLECKSQLDYEPLSDVEEKILDIIKEHLGGKSYTKRYDWDDLDDEDKEAFSKIYYDKVINDYLEEEPNSNYSKLKWFYRRLTQLGVPYAVDYTISHITQLTPIINDICEYLVSAAPNYSGELVDKGTEIHSILDTELIKSSSFFQIALINLFSRAKDLNHFEIFARNFHSYPDFVKRKIFLIANAIGAADWIREYKELYVGFSEWTKSAFLISCGCLPDDERKFFFETAREYLDGNDILENLIMKWAKEK